MTKKFRKTVIINRAVPGSGKTTIAKSINAAMNRAGLNIGLHSTDEYFMVNGRYIFDVSKLGEFHRRNAANFERDLRVKKDVVICDNTNLIPWQTEEYTRHARQNGYYIVFINFAPRELKLHLQAQMVTPEKPDAHGVPENVLQQFIDDFNTYNGLLNRNVNVDVNRHFAYRWDERNCERVRLPGTAKHFDSDTVLNINPDTYHDVKNTIGGHLLELIAQ